MNPPEYFSRGDNVPTPPEMVTLPVSDLQAILQEVDDLHTTHRHQAEQIARQEKRIRSLQAKLGSLIGDQVIEHDTQGSITEPHPLGINAFTVGSTTPSQIKLDNHQLYDGVTAAVTDPVMDKIEKEIERKNNLNLAINERAGPVCELFVRALQNKVSTRDLAKIPKELPPSNASPDYEKQMAKYVKANGKTIAWEESDVPVGNTGQRANYAFSATYFPATFLPRLHKIDVVSHAKGHVAQQANDPDSHLQLTLDNNGQVATILFETGITPAKKRGTKVSEHPLTYVGGELSFYLNAQTGSLILREQPKGPLYSRPTETWRSFEDGLFRITDDSPLDSTAWELRIPYTPGRFLERLDKALAIIPTIQS